MSRDWQHWLATFEQPAFLLDPEYGDIVAANGRAGEMTGFRSEELTGLGIRDLHPFEMARFNEFAQAALTRGMERTRGLTCRHRLGHHIAAEICATRVDLDGRCGLLAIVRPVAGSEPAPETDDAEDRSAEEQRSFEVLQHRLAVTRHLLDHAPEMVLWVRPDGSIAYANITAAERLGMERSALERMAIWDLDTHVRATDFPGLVERFRGHGGANFETEMVDGSNHRFPVSVTVELVRPDNEEYLVSFSRDITEEVRAREEARRYLSELAAVARRMSMSEMASALSHEINQPLTSISTYCRSALRLLDREPLPRGRLQQALESILKGTERTGQIVGKLREYVKDHEPTREETDLPALLEECTTLLGPEARHQSIELVMECPSALPLAMIDRILILQVVLNLARNGIEAMQPTPVPERTLEIRANPSSDGMLTISVRDNGPGIPPELAERLFEPFVSTKSHGMGIGLSLCRSIVESHGGALWHDQETTRGAKFLFSLPTKNTTSADVDTHRTDKASSSH